MRGGLQGKAQIGWPQGLGLELSQWEEKSLMEGDHELCLGHIKLEKIIQFPSR